MRGKRRGQDGPSDHIPLPSEQQDERGRRATTLISTGEGYALQGRLAAVDRMWQARWATAACFLLLGIVFGSWVARIPAVQNALDLSDGQLGVALLGTSLGAIVAMPITGWLVRQWGDAAVMRGAATLLCCSLPVLPLAPTMPLLMLALLAFGVGSGLVDVAMNTHAVTVERGYGRPLMSGFHGVFSVGGLVGAAGAGGAAGLGIAPFPHLLGVALALLVTAHIAGRGLLAETTRDETGPTFVLPPRSLLGLGLLGFCVFLSEGAVSDWSAVYLENVLGSSAAVAAAGYASYALAMAGMRFGGDALTARFGPPAVVFAGGLLAAVGMAGVILVGTVPVAIAGFACVGLGLAAGFPIALSAAGRTPGIAPAAAIGAVATAAYGGLLLGPPTIGFIAESAGLRTGLAFVAALCLVSALLAGSVRHSLPAGSIDVDPLVR